MTGNATAAWPQTGGLAVVVQIIQAQQQPPPRTFLSIPRRCLRPLHPRTSIHPRTVNISTYQQSHPSFLKKRGNEKKKTTKKTQPIPYQRTNKTNGRCKDRILHEGGGSNLFTDIFLVKVRDVMTMPFRGVGVP